MRLPTLLTAALALPLFLAACQPPSQGKDAAGPAAVVTGGEDLVMPDDAPPQEDAVAPTEAGAMSCTLDQGADGAAALAARCTAVSPASHPPCNPANPCQMIQDEIDRQLSARVTLGQKAAEAARRGWRRLRGR